ncbi:MAG: hypothetical protein E6J90_46870 [Deltaproteobacteria bacterium]|nr:MAG: hypothetical protein E6J90_46870 [Deltaproteobacteria bacterium]
MPRSPRAATPTLLAAAIGCALLGAPALAEAHITRIEITQVESPAFGGAAFGDVGLYEKLIGRAFGEVDPRAPENRAITDIELAPRNARGMVEYDTGILILRPVDPAKGNRRLFYELTNRGVILSLRALDDSPNPSTTNPAAADAGNGFLMRRGYTLLYTGWDLSAVGPFASHFPVATQRNGAPIVGPAIDELIFDNPPAVQPMTATLSYPAAALDTAQATLTVRSHYGDAQTAIPATGWRFNDARTIQLLPEGTRFDPGRLYELAYQARNPVVSGLALAAVRDTPAFLHRATTDDTGAANPLAGRIDVVIGHGISQPARLLHDLVHLGFNRDERGHQVFDGILSYIAGASSGFFNYRFAQPFRTHRQHIGRWTPERVFPFANQLLFDPVTDRFGGRLVRCTLTGTCPKILEANSSNEYWVKGGSLLHTDTRGHDLLFDAPGVRTYLFSSLPHSPSAGPGICEQGRNPLSPAPGLRALLVDLDDWISHRTPPPASRLRPVRLRPAVRRRHPRHHDLGRCDRLAGGRLAVPGVRAGDRPRWQRSRRRPVPGRRGPGRDLHRLWLPRRRVRRARPVRRVRPGDPVREDPRRPRGGRRSTAVARGALPEPPGLRRSGARRRRGARARPLPAAGRRRPHRPGRAGQQRRELTVDPRSDVPGSRRARHASRAASARSRADARGTSRAPICDLQARAPACPDEGPRYALPRH